MDYHEQLRWVEMWHCRDQHILSLRVFEELEFAHKNCTTFDLEFYETPPKVIRNLRQIRGNTEPQDWYIEYRLTTPHPSPTINAILRYFRKI